MSDVDEEKRFRERVTAVSDLDLTDHEYAETVMDIVMDLLKAQTETRRSNRIT
jgi:hypothetical protein